MYEEWMQEQRERAAAAGQTLHDYAKHQYLKHLLLARDYGHSAYADIAIADNKLWRAIRSLTVGLVAFGRKL